MILLLAVVLHVLGRLLPSFILRRSIGDLRSDLKWRQPVIELSGFIADFVLAFIIMFILIVPKKYEYLPNENAIYGVICSEEAKVVGFKDGDRILTVDNATIEKFSDIILSIVLSPGDAEIEVSRGDSVVLIEIDDEAKMILLKAQSVHHFTPQQDPENITPLETVEYRKGVSDVFKALESIKNQIKLLWSPKSAAMDGAGFFKVEVKDVRSFFAMLAFNLVFVGLINLIPLPGLDVGNSIVALIESARKKRFPLKAMKILRIVCIGGIAILLLTMLLIS